MAENLKIHEERLEQLMAYYAGDVVGEARAELEAHLEGCQECQTTLRQAKEVLPFAEAYLAFKPKHTIDEQVARFEAMWAERDQVKERPPRRWGRWWGLTLGAAAAAVAVALLVFLWKLPAKVQPDRDVYAPGNDVVDGGMR